MHGSYHAKCLGEALQRVLSQNDSTFSRIQFAWHLLICMPNLVPHKYIPNTKTLVVYTNRPVIYMQHYAELIKSKYNEFFEDEVISIVKLRFYGRSDF